MENYDNEIFGFENDESAQSEQVNNFDYDSLSGLGESNYENEDLFNTEVDYSANNNFNSGNFGSTSDLGSDNYNGYSKDYLEKNVTNVQEEKQEVKPEEDMYFVDEYKLDELPQVDDPLTYSDVQSGPQENSTLEDSKEENESETPKVSDDEVIEESIDDSKGTSLSLSDTPIEELNKLTDYKEEKIETTDISDLFNKVSVNVKDASDIFKRNTDLKNKIDTRFEELKKLQSEIENSRKSQKDEIDKYKEEVLGKLTEKKEEIEKRLNLLKETQSNLEKEKNEFEQYKKKEQENIDKVQKEVQAAYDDRREELSHIEDVLRKQKDALDEERNQLSLDKMEYESDKNELANNLLKFNDLVNSFTSGVGDIKE